MNIQNEKRIRDIQNEYKTLKELHGSCVTQQEMSEIIASTNNIPIDLVQNVIAMKFEEIKTTNYGMVIGRFKPFHYGHNHIINEILLDGLVPIVFIGDDRGKDPSRNPLTFNQTKELIKLVYPNVEIIFYQLFDQDNWTDWFDNLGHMAVGSSGRTVEQLTLYYNNKEQDRHDHFECQGREYINEFYTKIFEDNDIKTHQVAFVERNDIIIDADATNIRDDIEAYKHLLDARVYDKLKEWKW